MHRSWEIDYPSQGTIRLIHDYFASTSSIDAETAVEVVYTLPVCDAGHIPADVWTEIIGALWESYSPLAHDQHVDASAYRYDARRGLLSLSVVNSMFRGLTLPWLSKTLGPFSSTVAFLSRVATRDPHVMLLSNFVNSLNITSYIQCNKLSDNPDGHNESMQEAPAPALCASSVLLHVDIETFRSLYSLSLTISLLSPSNLTSIFALTSLREFTLTKYLSIGDWPDANWSCTPWAGADRSALGVLSKLHSFSMTVDEAEDPVWEFLPLLRQNLNIQQLAELCLESPTVKALSMLLVGGCPYNLETLVLSDTTIEAIFSLPVLDLLRLTRLELNRLARDTSESLPSQTRLGCLTFPQLVELTSPAFVLYAFKDCPRLTWLYITADKWDNKMTTHKFPIPTFCKVTDLAIPSVIHDYVDMNVTFPAVENLKFLLDHTDLYDVDYYDWSDHDYYDHSSNSSEYWF
jgi:hypothetical protein